MRIPKFRPAQIIIIALFLFSCNKTEEFVTDPLSDYIPLQVGKFITYRTDSTVFTNFGTVEETHKYQIKHVVDAQLTDNLGRPSYRIYTYLRDTAGIQPWQPTGSYFITPLTDQVELIENNQRIIKLHLPVRDGNSWKGNKFLPSDPYGSIYTFSDDDNMADWDFYFDGSSEESTVINGNTYNNVYTIQEADESYNYPITNPDLYASQIFSQEKYAKDIGLVYRNLILWEYQPNPGAPSSYKTGFGIKMWMIDHN